MAVVATMAQTSTSQPNLWKPRYAAKQHQEKPQPAQQFTRSRSLREPFDAAELTRKLENYRQELKLEKARREQANKKAEKALGSAQPPTTQQDVSTTAPEVEANAGSQRAQASSVPKSLIANEQPERRRSLIHRSRKQSAQEDTAPIEPAKPFIPRVAAKQFANTTTPLKEKAETPSTTSHQASESKPKEVKVKDTSRKHVLDWNEPALHHKPSSPPLPSTLEYPDAEKSQARMQALHAFRDASKAGRPRPLSTALENMRDWDAVDNVYSKPSKPIHEESASPAYINPLNRPMLKAADRHDWAQGSQCGDSARQSLHLFRKKDSAHEEAEMAGLRASMRPAAPKPRQKSHGDASDHLIGDAVKQIREERRRSSLFNIFRRH
ncbi:hypothetical protein KCU81_g3623, partial [Aureobasidium melanogenum]|uniref:Uncharacterized protein n=1 Tax=Aureobasidium melanogenum (strain CBS 110374) TaxID=1043003 RepID=A0A074VS23_AURM1